MNKPVISFASAAIRNERYKSFYNSIVLENTVPFEVVFVGNKPPIERMPDNFRYIETDVRPIQCYEIAVRASLGDYVHIIADDISIPKGYLNTLYSYTLMLDMDRVLLSVRGCHPNGRKRNRNYIDHGHVFDAWAINAPFCGYGPLYRRDIWMKLGGIDSNFFGDFADMDIQRRFYEHGLRPFMVPECILEECDFYHGKNNIKKDEMSLSQRSWQHDMDVIKKCWYKEDGSISHNRLMPVISFSDKDILSKNQF